MPMIDAQIAWTKQVLALLGAPQQQPPGPLLERELGPQYRGEDRSAAWRYDPEPDESDDDFAARAGRGDVVTRYQDATARAANTLKTLPTGKVVLADGSSAEGQRLYAMDPATGDIVTGQGGHRIAELDASGNPTGGLLPQGALIPDIVRAINSGGRQRVEAEHHSSLLAGGNVAAAGQVTVQGGNVTSVSNESGHYRPEFQHLLQAVEALVRSGAMLDTQIVDADGNDVRTTNPRAFSAWVKVAALETEVLRDGADIDALIERTDDPMVGEAEQQAAVAALEDLIARVARLHQAKAMLRKAGIGPANRLAGTVKIVYATQDSDDVHAAVDGVSARTLPVDEFLMGTAALGNAPVRDGAARQALVQEVAQRTQRRRPENRPPGTQGIIREGGPTPAGASASRADLQRQIEEFDGSSPLPPGTAAAAPAGGAAPNSGRGYDIVNMGLVQAAANDDDDGPPAAPRDGGRNAASAPEAPAGDGASRYGSVPGKPPATAGEEPLPPLPNRPAEPGYASVPARK